MLASNVTCNWLWVQDWPLCLWNVPQAMSTKNQWLDPNCCHNCHWAQKMEPLTVVWVIRKLLSCFVSSWVRPFPSFHEEQLQSRHFSLFRDSFLGLPDTLLMHNDVLWANSCLSSSSMFCSRVKPSLWAFHLSQWDRCSLRLRFSQGILLIMSYMV